MQLYKHINLNALHNDDGTLFSLRVVFVGYLINRGCAFSLLGQDVFFVFFFLDSLQ